MSKPHIAAMTLKLLPDEVCYFVTKGLAKNWTGSEERSFHCHMHMQYGRAHAIRMNSGPTCLHTVKSDRPPGGGESSAAAGRAASASRAARSRTSLAASATRLLCRRPLASPEDGGRPPGGVAVPGAGSSGGAGERPDGPRGLRMPDAEEARGYGSRPPRSLQQQAQCVSTKCTSKGRKRATDCRPQLRQSAAVHAATFQIGKCSV